eukprot:TRINITY_DN18637_c0_g1_i1.p1 TRINITY_DN18637_c0_g1~~TRINITY_DN18637_c0_g1_i1.p1  ORF type:complete len:400 (+),score=66.17 TRINITY_DN18637_c0_g1_i1:129-1328(+)
MCLSSRPSPGHSHLSAFGSSLIGLLLLRVRGERPIGGGERASAPPAAFTQTQESIVGGVSRHGDFMGSFCTPSALWTMDWQDEFDGDKLRDDWWRIIETSPKDKLTTKAPVAGLGATACRTADCVPENVKVENGYLNLLSEATDAGFRTGAVTTQGMDKAWDDGTPYRLCVRAKLPGGGQGVWPAHWMLPENGIYDKRLDDGEVDILEMINADGNAYGTYHWMTKENYDDFDKYHKSKASMTKMPSYFAETFHEFAVERSKDHITFVVDGQPTQVVRADEIGKQLSHKPFFLILNTAIGGGWPGEPSAGTSLPVTHSIDYVRVLRRKVGEQDSSSPVQDAQDDSPRSSSALRGLHQHPQEVSQDLEPESLMERVNNIPTGSSALEIYPDVRPPPPLSRA